MRRHVLGAGAPFVLLVSSWGLASAQDLLSTVDSDLVHDQFGRVL